MQISRSVEVAAPADRVWALVSDLPAMGALSPENAGGSWTRGATGPAVGARFRGVNRSGWRRWSTSVRVVQCEPGSDFAFAVSFMGFKVADWSYAVRPAAGGCTVTETWSDSRGFLVKTGGAVLTGVSDREAFTASSIEQTLAAVKAAAER